MDAPHEDQSRIQPRDTAADGDADAAPAAAGPVTAGDAPVAAADLEAASLPIWRNLAEMDDQLFRQRGLRLLTPEARILIYLKMHGAVPVTAAMQVSGTSYRGFYAVLERMKQAGIIAQIKDTGDQRVRKISIDPAAPISPANF